LSTLIEGVGMLRRRSSSKNESSATIHAAVPPILDGIVASTMKSTSNLGPPLPHFSNHAFNLQTFFRADRFVIQ